MPVIALVGNKGGAGKTTLSMNMAAGLARTHQVAVLDADPQGSSSQWHTIADENSLPVVFPAQTDIAQQMQSLQAQYEYIVADCPPSVHAPQTHAVLRITDIALVPVQPSPMDLWATIHIEHAIEQAREMNPSLKTLLVINQLETRSTLSQLMRDALAEIDAPVADTAIRRRAIYRSSALEGRSVFNIGKRGTDAAVELDNLIKEVIGL